LGRKEGLGWLAAPEPSHPPSLPPSLLPSSPSQSLSLRLRQRSFPLSPSLTLPSPGVPTKLLLYPQDGHALDRPRTQADMWLQAGEWLRRHLG
jgi:hypothetical protein